MTWTTRHPYALEAGRTCPMRYQDEQGRWWRYQGGLVAGEPIYVREPLTFGSLFAGIGGMDLGLERSGMRCAWQVEIDDYATRVLAKHWPDVPRFRDVRDVGQRNLPPVDVIAGGFPCQDISVAGRGAGITGARSGLWSEFARIIGELRPRYVIVENVAKLLSGERGRWFGRVLGDLAEIGYDAEWNCIPAAALGAPHTRERVFVVAHPRQERCEHRSIVDTGYAVSTHEQWHTAQDIKHWTGWQRWLGSLVQNGNPIGARSGLLGMADGVSYRLERIGGLGNAVVPQVAEFVGQCIVDYEASL